MPDKTKPIVRVKRTISVTFDENQVKQILRDAAKAPANADVRIDGSISYIDEAIVEWTEDEPDA